MSGNGDTGCPYHTGHKARLDNHDERLNRGERRMDRIETAIEATNKALSDAVQEALRRPSWIVTTIISLLMAMLGFAISSIVGLLT